MSSSPAVGTSGFGMNPLEIKFGYSNVITKSYLSPFGGTSIVGALAIFVDDSTGTQALEYM